jgi:hypothetical protein
MKQTVLLFVTIVLTVSGFAQRSADIGVWGGSSTYWGDIREASPMQSLNLNLGAYFRYNFNQRVGLRAMFMMGNFSAEGIVENEDIMWDFNKTVQDLAVQVEINYLKYVLGQKKTPFTPYILGGFGMMFFPYTLDPARLAGINPWFAGQNVVEESVVTPTIPFGFGVKFSIGKKLGVAMEYQLRKTLTDKLDDLDDPLTFSTTNNNGEEVTIKYSDSIHNNDWPGYAGIHITYKIYFSKNPCPAYERKYW